MDSQGRAVPPGELGERVLLTIFSRRTQPLIRYEISDMLRLSAARCECGRPFRCLDEIEGRQEDVLYFGDVAIHPNLFHRVLETVPASGWQVVQEDRGVTVNLTGLRDDGAGAGIAAEVQKLLVQEGAGRVTVEVRSVGELVRGKTGKAPLVMRAISTPASLRSASL